MSQYISKATLWLQYGGIYSLRRMVANRGRKNRFITFWDSNKENKSFEIHQRGDSFSIVMNIVLVLLGLAVWWFWLNKRAINWILFAFWLLRIYIFCDLTFYSLNLNKIRSTFNVQWFFLIHTFISYRFLIWMYSVS